MKQLYWALPLALALCLLVANRLPQGDQTAFISTPDSSSPFAQLSTDEGRAKRILDNSLEQLYQITEYTILDSGTVASESGEDCYWYRCLVSDKPISGQGIPIISDALSDMPRVTLPNAEDKSTPKALPQPERSPQKPGEATEEDKKFDLLEERIFYIYGDRLYLENPVKNSKRVPG